MDIQVTGPLRPKVPNTPLDARTVINSLTDIASIKLPFVGMFFTTLNDNKTYKVTEIDVNELLITSYIRVSDEEVLEDYAPLDSPEFTGTPKAPTTPFNDNSDNIATTKFAQNLLQDTEQAIQRETEERQADVAAINEAIAQGVGTTEAVLNPAISESSPSSTNGATEQAIVNFVNAKDQAVLDQTVSAESITEALGPAAETIIQTVSSLVSQVNTLQSQLQTLSQAVSTLSSKAVIISPEDNTP